MKKVSKILLIFSGIFWGLVLVGILLFSFSFQKVPIGYYGLRVNLITGSVDDSFYTAGLFLVNLGYYFNVFPAVKVLVADLGLKLSNQESEDIEVTYSFVYRQNINPQKLYTLYMKYGYQYQKSLVARIDNIVTSNFLKANGSSTNIGIQSKIIQNINNNSDLFFRSYFAVEALWIDEIEYSERTESLYSSLEALIPSMNNLSYLQQQNWSLKQMTKALLAKLESARTNQYQKQYSNASLNGIVYKEEAKISISNLLKSLRALSYNRPFQFLFK